MALLLAMVLLRVATYNVHSCRGLDLRMKPDRIARVIQDTRADVVALEEVRAGQAQSIAEKLGFNFVFGTADVLGGYEFGNAILTRFPIAAHENYPIGIPNREQRACLRADIDVPGMAAPIHIFAVHLGLGHRERQEQVARLLKIAGPEGILLGDFNEFTNGKVNRALIAVLKRSPKRTYPGLLPLFGLDRIYVDDRFTIRSQRLTRSWTALFASDHVPLSAEISVAGAAPNAQSDKEK